MQTSELIDLIRNVLDERATSVPAEVLAMEYAKRCREVNDRFEKIGMMLSGGGEIQALQLAEQPPRVVDLALALSFGGEVAWQEFCMNRGHEMAPMVDVRTLESLLEAQQQRGLSSNHPLYKDYRTAVSKRDDKQALDLIRVISRMNPGDENAARELARLQRKALQAGLEALKSCLANGGDLLQAMAAVEESGNPEAYETSPVWHQASAERVRFQRQAAWIKMPDLLSAAEEFLRGGAWRQAAASYEEYAGLASIHGHDRSKAEECDSRAASIHSQLEKFRVEAEREGKARELVTEMERIAEDVETRGVTPQGITPEFASPLLESLTQKQRKLESLRGEFPERQRIRVEAAKERLMHSLERQASSKRFKAVFTIAAVLILLLTGTGFGVLAFRASSHTEILSALRTEQSSAGLRELVSSIPKEEPWLLRFPKLSTEIAESRQWLASVDSKNAVVAEELERMERAQSEGFADIPSSDLYSQIGQVGTFAAELPRDVAEQSSSRLVRLRNEVERTLTARQKENEEQAITAVTEWEGVLGAVDHKGASSLAAAAIAPAAEKLAPLLKLEELQAPLLRLPAQTAAKLKDVATRVTDLKAQTDASHNALEALQLAASVAAYREALDQLASTAFSEAVSAQVIKDQIPDDERLKALLLLRGNLAAFKTAQGDQGISVPVPQEVSPADREIVIDLVKNQVLNDIWEVEWRAPGGKTQKCLSQGPLAATDDGGRVGMVAPYPRLKFADLTYVKRYFAKDSVTSNSPTAVASMMAGIGVNNLIDPSGSKFKQSVLPMLDVVANNTKAPALAKAYVFGRLIRLVTAHKPEEWGAHYCPALNDDIEEFTRLEMSAPIQAASWLASPSDDEVARWNTYFKKRGQRASFEQLRKTRKACMEGIAQDVEIVGRVGIDGTITLSEKVAERMVMGVVLEDGKPSLKVCGIISEKGEWRPSQPDLAPFSPLLSVQLTPESMDFLFSLHFPANP
jgi:hypothetical protein